MYSTQLVVRLRKKQVDGFISFMEKDDELKVHQILRTALVPSSLLFAALRCSSPSGSRRSRGVCSAHRRLLTHFGHWASDSLWSAQRWFVRWPLLQWRQSVSIQCSACRLSGSSKRWILNITTRTRILQIPVNPWCDAEELES